MNYISKAKIVNRQSLTTSFVIASWCLCALSVQPSPVRAQSGNGYDLTWSSIDGGGAMFSTGNGYELGSTIGQAEAGEFSGGGYTLGGGFWFAAASSGGPCGFSCTNASDCVSDPANNACNQATCAAGCCTYTCIRFADIAPPPNGVVNLDDILCVLAGFAALPNCPDGDVHPCGGNGVINLDDILNLLTAFAGGNPCACTENSAPGTGVAPLCGSSQP